MNFICSWTFFVEKIKHLWIYTSLDISLKIHYNKFEGFRRFWRNFTDIIRCRTFLQLNKNLLKISSFFFCPKSKKIKILMMIKEVIKISAKIHKRNHNDKSKDEIRKCFQDIRTIIKKYASIIGLSSSFFLQNSRCISWKILNWEL